jgi:DNA-binding response OmpR family regulator
MSSKKTMILAAEDDVRTLRFVSRSLETEKYEVVTARDGQEALEQVEAKAPDLILLDLMLPKLSGFEVCQYIRAFSAMPIIVLTACGQVEQKARAFDLGADDYLTKPFSVVELLARIRAVLRRAQWGVDGNGRNGQPRVTIGNLVVDFSQHEVRVDGRLAMLTPIEYRILAYLTRNAGLVVSHDLLLEHVWGSEYVSESHLLKVNINRLRNKIEADPAHPRYIITKPGFGYMLPAQPAITESKEADSSQEKEVIEPTR